MKIFPHNIGWITRIKIWRGIIQKLRNAWGGGGGRVANFVTNRYGNEEEGKGDSVTPLRNTDKIFYMANFTRNLPIGNYSLYYISDENYSSDRLIL